LTSPPLFSRQIKEKEKEKDKFQETSPRGQRKPMSTNLGPHWVSFSRNTFRRRKQEKTQINFFISKISSPLANL